MKLVRLQGYTARMKLGKNRLHKLFSMLPQIFRFNPDMRQTKNGGQPVDYRSASTKR